MLTDLDLGREAKLAHGTLADRPFVVGIDIGGTKTAVRVHDSIANNVVFDAVFPSTGWTSSCPRESAEWIVRTLAANDLLEPVRSASSVVIGAHGCETEEDCHALMLVLRSQLSSLDEPVLQVVNDGQLIAPAAGYEDGVGIVVGTGSVAQGYNAEGHLIRAGGYGWVFGDNGSGSALVREAVKLVLQRADFGQPLGVLGDLLLGATSCADTHDLAWMLSWQGGVETWGPYAPIIFEAALRDAGAAELLRLGARDVVEMVRALRSRGVTSLDIVVGGGLAANQPIYASLIEQELQAFEPHAKLHVLCSPPVAGAVLLAHGVLLHPTDE